jgi:hypothetical protein
MLAETFEAVMGAVYTDGGLQVSAANPALPILHLHYT